ncbi:Protein kinase-like (PK-like) [Venustampulla echinocandica]|uniref:Protein kinase-like (PK-like) n=1 Tax=Venustampulla echinocandica TaxID=2656787 RepID=A0A370TTL3_9HELO|nr:Protein kinase-like (PK-like) [Venustampulla echinocandica]RDL38869.1 Protein kinase-like (PK-like) [Venustampulla echinocandica]
MTQAEKPPREGTAAFPEHKMPWSWKRLFGKEDHHNHHHPPLPPPLQEDTTRPGIGIARRISRKVVPGIPRQGTFKRQQSELRDRLVPVIPNPDERRTVSVDRRLNGSARDSSIALAGSPRLSAPELLETTDTIEAVLDNGVKPPPETKLEEVQEYVDVSKDVSAVETQSISTEAFDEMILEELEKKWILNLSMHFRDKSKREKFFVTFAETPTHWRRVTVSLDYRNAPEGSLEEELLRTKFQRDKSARIYEAIRESLPDIQFYDTVTNLKLQTENERLHVHVVEDVSEIISYPPVRAINHLGCRRIREDELVFDSHLSGFVYKVRVNGQVFIKKEIPGPDTVDEFLYEINALHQLSGSRSVIQFGGVVLDNRGEFVKGLLISFAEQGALIDVIYDGDGKLPWERRERWAREIVQGLAEIHEAGFVQGDFTLSNIVIDEYDRAKIIDINRRGCPVGWEPPEVRDLIDSNQRISMYIGVKSDLYQLGMVMFALATQHDEPETQRPLNLACFPPEIPDYFLDICHRCLDDDPRRRLQASALLTLFPEMEDRFDEGPSQPVPIVVDAQHMDEKPYTNGNHPCSFGVHSPPYSSLGIDRSINVYDYAVTDVSDDTEFYPRRGRSPPAPQRFEKAGTVMPFSEVSISFLEAHIPPPEVSIPLPESSTTSEILETTETPGRHTSGAGDPVEITPTMASGSVEQDIRGEHPTGLAASNARFNSLDSGRHTPSNSEPLEEILTAAASCRERCYESQHIEPVISNPESEKRDPLHDIPATTSHQEALPIPATLPNDYDGQEQRPIEQEATKMETISTSIPTPIPTEYTPIPETQQEPRPTAAAPPEPSSLSSSTGDLVGVGGGAHFPGTTDPDLFEIPPALTSLDDDDDLMNDMRKHTHTYDDRIILDDVVVALDGL